MTDGFGRDIYYLRLSVTDLCNLRCVYCMPEEGVRKREHSEILSIEEIEELVSAAARNGIRKVRITGGEPLVRRGIVSICSRVSHTAGIEELCLTTNGALLPRFAVELKSAGVSRLNISLDSLNAQTYRQITRNGELKDALKGVEAAVETGFDAIKINAVLIGGVNDGEIRDLIELTKRGNINVRFIELMPIGESAGWSRERFISNEAVLKAAPELRPVGGDGVARLYKAPGSYGTIGLISPVSSHFCPSCNRIRITSDGKLKPCLHSAWEIDLRGLHGEELFETMREAIASKPQRHHLEEADSESLRNMNAIGG